MRRQSTGVLIAGTVACLSGGIFPGCAYPLRAERALRCSGTHSGPLAPGETALRWLGTAGYEIRHRSAARDAESVILIDPFLSRPGFGRFLRSKWFKTPLQTDAPSVDRLICTQQLAFDRAECIFISHGHFDHVMDAPHLALKYCPQAQLYGSSTVLYLAEALGVDRVRLHDSGNVSTVQCGDFEVTPVPSLHAKLFGECVYNTGDLRAPPALPLSEEDYKLGRQFNYLIRVDGLTIYHHGCADLIDDEIRKKVGRVDVLILGLALRGNTPEYLERMLALTDPSIIIPTHYDDFFQPFRRGVRVMRNTKFTGFVRTVRAIKPSAQIVTLDFFQELRLPASGVASRSN